MKWTNESAGKIQVNRFNDAARKLSAEHNTFVELIGVIGREEHSSTLWSMCGNAARPDVIAAQEKVGTAHNWTLTKENAATVTAAILAELPALQANRPVHDKRTTPEVADASAAEYVQVKADRETAQRAERETWLATYGSGETVTIQPGQIAVIARMCYDNSDSMTDYFDRHASLSPEFVLLIASKQAETEKLARRGVAASEMLSALKLDWHTEKYSMGRGNYLESEGFELPEGLKTLRTYYRGGQVTHGHWEIQFRAAYSEPIELPAFVGYGDVLDRTPVASSDSPAVSVSEITVTENTEKNGIEIRFPAKPSTDVLSMLKAEGWRWSRFSKCWYKRATDEARQFANSLAVVTAASTAA